jgi:Antitoxin FitA-like, ribbon-helix-helix
VTVNAITLRNLPAAVARAVKQKATKEGLSLNKAVVRLLEEATGQRKEEGPGRPVAHHDLDHLFGTWSEAEYDGFMEALREQRQVDPEMWR